VPDAFELRHRHLAQVRDSFDLGDPGPSRDARREGLAEELGVDRVGDAAGGHQRSRPEGGVAEEERGGLTAAEDVGDHRHPRRVECLVPRWRGRRCDDAARTPRDVGRHDQRGDLPRGSECGPDRVGRVDSERLGI